MAEGVPIKVTLKRIQVLDTLDPGHREHGQFVFSSKVSSQNQGGIVHESRFPEEGSWKISDHPRKNRVKVDAEIFSGNVEDHLIVELVGEELDKVTASDFLDHYSREFSGSPESWIGLYGPGGGTEDASQPEDMSNWRVWYEISTA
jgi:hypothetical protein